VLLFFNPIELTRVAGCLLQPCKSFNS